MRLWLREFACMLRHTYIARLDLYFLHSLPSITVTECNQQPDRRLSIDRSLPAAEQRTVLPTAQLVLPFLRKVMDYFVLWLEHGCTRFPKKIYGSQLKILGARRAVMRREFRNGGP